MSEIPDPQMFATPLSTGLGKPPVDNASSRIDVSSIQDQVVNAIRDMLLAGEIQPGALITESALSELFGVSRTPIREALKQLQVEGLVEIRPRVGTFASKRSLEEAQEISPIREVLEGLAARLFATHRDPELLAKLEQAVVGSEADVDEGRIDAYALKVYDFHDLILEGAASPQLTEVHRRVNNKMAYHRKVFRTLNQVDRPRHSVQEHREIFDHIRAGEPEAAEEAMRLHVRKSHVQFMKALVAQQTLPPLELSGK